ncbi:MAG: NAD-dependent epimerase/dehydratase family protein [Armatimonadetes bacterium]|nr:NAD-dependent epimerase/dehydratase family protein [Armatimonadota bacterium]
MTFLVTGASGLVGGQVVRDLKALGHRVVAMSRTCPDTSPVDEWVLGDLATIDWKASVGGIDGIAAIGGSLDMRSSAEAWQTCLDVNVLGLRRLVDFALDQGVSRFVYTSSAGLYRRPAENLPVNVNDEIRPARPYWTSKLLGEQLLTADDVAPKLNPWILRLSSPYGPTMPTRSVLPIFIDRARKGEPLAVRGTGSRSQDFISVWDASWAHVQCLLTDAKSPGPINLGSGIETSMLNLAKAVNDTFGNSTPIVFEPDDGSDSDRFVLDVSDLKALFAYTPMDLCTGLKRFSEESNS